MTRSYARPSLRFDTALGDALDEGGTAKCEVGPDPTNAAVMLRRDYASWITRYGLLLFLQAIDTIVLPPCRVRLRP
jgi:hypothetical protein